MKIFIAASWLKLGGVVTRTLLELFKHINYSKHDSCRTANADTMQRLKNS